MPKEMPVNAPIQGFCQLHILQIGDDLNSGSSGTGTSENQNALASA